jgi:hypothetical protein
MFQGVMDEKQRRELGAHYTSEENILKLINPLFLDDLWTEFDRVKTNEKALDSFHNKIARLKFLDPACGCGNFLIITYREIRALELEILRMKHSSNQLLLEFTNLLKVSVEQFYGIEYENFPCQIAQVGMWLIDHQMNMRVSDEFGVYHARLPLTQSATIVHGNALRMNWDDVVPKHELSYILGNPPFVGARMMSEEQKADITDVVETQAHFTPRYKNLADNLDYVAAWYFKAAQHTQGTRVPVGFVSTNSIAQGEQVAPLWDTLINDYAVEINFAYRTFKWGNEAKGKAAVHCVIIGYSRIGTKTGSKSIFDDGTLFTASNISPYLVDAPSIIVKPQKKPLCDVPEMKFGSQPRDGGHFVLSAEERTEILQKEPKLESVIRPYVGAEEFLQDKERFCIWLLDAPFEIIGGSKILRERIAAVEEFRLASKAKTTNQYAKVPSIFAQIAQPGGAYLLVPRVSSENRRYIPVGFMDETAIASDAVQIIPSATLYHFGILTSNVHMAWMRTVAGRLKSDYRYSKELVYNTFPWPDANDKQRNEIEKLAQAILDERSKHKGSSLAKLYDPINMKITGLQKVHQSLDSAVMKLYGFPVKKDFTEAHCVAALMEMYQKLTEGSGLT